MQHSGDRITLWGLCAYSFMEVLYINENKSKFVLLYFFQFFKSKFFNQHEKCKHMYKYGEIKNKERKKTDHTD